MAEAEDVIVDAARHATVFAQRWWRRRRPLPTAPRTVVLDDVAHRLDVLNIALFGASFPLRKAQPPARPTLLAQLARRRAGPIPTLPLPATDGLSIWLPADSMITDRAFADACYRAMALLQASRIRRGSARVWQAHPDLSPLHRAVYLLFEALSAEGELADRVPGVEPCLRVLRDHAVTQRPSLDTFPPACRHLETFVVDLLRREREQLPAGFSYTRSPDESLELARRALRQFAPDPRSEHALGAAPLWQDWWTGALVRADRFGDTLTANDEMPDGDVPQTPARSVHLERRPERREAAPDEDDERERPGPWMVQVEQPHPAAEDPMGLQRPVDRDDETSAQELGEMLSELTEARLVTTPGRPREVLLSDDPPPGTGSKGLPGTGSTAAGIVYPEWDYRIAAYREPGATVRLLTPRDGPRGWVDTVLDEHATLIATVQRRFEMLRPERETLRRRDDGEELDLDAWLDSDTDYRVGLPRSEAIYQTRRPARQNLAISLLIDVSGSTDSWVAAHRRVIDVEREALLIVCMALDALGEPYAVQAFSGEGPADVQVWDVKRFDEPYADPVALRIAALEPEHYTRTGAALRHASAGLARQPAAHRLLLLLSDGKPHDRDEYEGRYGVEDMRQAVAEARQQGITPFCLTIDRQAASYLPRVFGLHHYALLTTPRALPQALLTWVKRLLVG